MTKELIQVSKPACPMQTPGISSTRRSFLATTLALSGLPSLGAVDRDAATAVAAAHAEVWRRFKDEYNIMIDFTDLDGSVALPTPGECREGKRTRWDGGRRSKTGPCSTVSIWRRWSIAGSRPAKRSRRSKHDEQVSSGCL